MKLNEVEQSQSSVKTFSKIWSKFAKKNWSTLYFRPSFERTSASLNFIEQADQSFYRKLCFYIVSSIFTQLTSFLHIYLFNFVIRSFKAKVFQRTLASGTKPKLTLGLCFVPEAKSKKGTSPRLTHHMRSGLGIKQTYHDQ